MSNVFLLLTDLSTIYWSYSQFQGLTTDSKNPCESYFIRGFVGNAGNYLLLSWCLGADSNRHALRHRILSPARLPIPSPRQVFAVEKLHYVQLRGESVTKKEYGLPSFSSVPLKIGVSSQILQKDLPVWPATQNGPIFSTAKVVKTKSAARFGPNSLKKLLSQPN